MNIYDLISRAQQLREETKLDSVSPDRVGALCEDTLKYINEFQLLASAPSLHKIYASVSAMQLDGAPKSDLTGKALKAGQLVVIVPESQTDTTAGDVYRYDGPSGNTSAWTFVAKIGGVPADAELNASSTNPVQNKAVTEKLAELSAEIDNLPIKDKFNKEGRYPALSAGFADNLTGHGESIPAEFTFRATGGRSITDGVARIKRIKGNSVVWNQKVDGELRVQYGTILHEGNRYTITPTGEYAGVLTEITTLIQGHKYICLCNKVGGSKPLYLNWGGYDSLANAIFAVTNVNKTHCTIYAINENETFTLTRPIICDLTQMFGAGNEPTTIEEYNARKPIVADEYAYNEGEVIHMTAEGIKSVGDNVWDEEWEIGGLREANGEEYASASYIRSGYIRVLPDTQYYFKKPLGVLTYLYYYDVDKNFVGWADPFATSEGGGVFTTMDSAYMRFACLQEDYNNDIMITLVHSGWKVDTDAGYQPYWEDVLVLDKRIREAFPNGMKSAGQASDMAYNKNGKGYVTARISSIDLGSLTWGIDSGGFAYSQTTIPAAVDSTGVSRNVICASFGVKQDAYWYPTTENVIMIAEQGKLFITGDILSGIAANELESQLEGVILFYESKTPTTYEVGEPFSFDYRVADFGTEEIITSEPSAPISADIIYQFNAVDQIRENFSEIEKIKAALVKAGFSLDW